MGSIFSENTKLVLYNERLEKEREHAISEQTRLRLKIADLKGIIQSSLQQKSVPEEANEEGNEVDRPLTKQKKVQVYRISF